MAKIVKSVDGMEAPERDESEDFEKRPNKFLLKLNALEAIEPLMFVDAYDVPTKFGKSTMLAFIDVDGVPVADYDTEYYVDKDGNECDKIVIGDIVYPMYAVFGDKKGAFAKAMLKMFTSDQSGESKREGMIGQAFKIGKSADIQSKSSEYSYNELRYKVLGEGDYDMAVAQKLLAEYKAIQAGFGADSGESRDTFADDEKAMAANDKKGMPQSEEAAVALALFKDGKKVRQVIKELVDGMEMTEDDASDLAMEVKQAM